MRRHPGGGGGAAAGGLRTRRRHHAGVRSCHRACVGPRTCGIGDRPGSLCAGCVQGPRRDGHRVRGDGRAAGWLADQAGRDPANRDAAIAMLLVSWPDMPRSMTERRAAAGPAAWHRPPTGAARRPKSRSTPAQPRSATSRCRSTGPFPCGRVCVATGCDWLQSPGTSRIRTEESVS